MSREEDFDYLFKIVIIGDSGVGKTNLLARFIDQSFSIDSKPTIGVQFATKTVLIQNKVVKNQIWDTAGQERFRAITNAYYRGAQGAIIVYDLTKSKTFQHIDKWLSELREHADTNISVMLLGNKSDLDERAIKGDVIEDYISQNKLLYLETSALSGDNVNESFNSLIKDIYDKMKFIPQQKKIESPIVPVTPPSQKDLEEPERNKKVGTIILDDEKKKKKSDKKKKNCC